MIPTILIVDDSASVHAIVSSLFVGEPWHVCSADSGGRYGNLLDDVSRAAQSA